MAAFAVVAAARWWTSHRREVFHITPDEPGQLAIARFVAGVGRWDMLNRSTWRPAYGTLLAPIHWLVSDPVAAYRAALVVNAALGGVACVLLCLLARRLTALSPVACVGAALVVALSPAVLFTTNWVWSEALVSVTYLATVVTMLRFHDRPTLGRGTAVVTLAVAGFATHSRLLPLLIVAVALFVAEATRGRVPVRRALCLTALTAMLTWAVSWYSAFLVERLWEQPQETNTVGSVVGRLTNVGAIADAAVGQAWYQLVTTAGLVGLGVIALVAATRRRDRTGTADARIVLLTTGSLVALSIVFMSDRLRPDQLVYGRYNDTVIGPIVVVGIGALLSMRRKLLSGSLGAIAVALTVAAVLLHVRHEDVLAADAGVRSMVLGLQSFVGTTPSIDVVAITAAALVVLGLVAVAALGPPPGRSWRRWSTVLVLALLVLVGNLRTRPVVDRNLNAWAMPDTALVRLREVLPEGATVRFRVVPDADDPAAPWGEQRRRTMLYQFYLPDHPMVFDSGGDPTSYVFAPLRDPALVAAGAEVVWRDPAVRIALWHEP